MGDKFDLIEVYEQNLNFLVGAGASFGFLPTLALKAKDANGTAYTFETLAKDLDSKRKDDLYTLLFMHYYQECIFPCLPRSPTPPITDNKSIVIREYRKFLQTLFSVLCKQTRRNKKANIYTTNYDNCLELSSDEIVCDNSIVCAINDGSEGFQSRQFHTKNFNNRVIQKGIFDAHDEYMPQINILHAHGSVYWRKKGSGIEVNYGGSEYEIEFSVAQQALIDGLGNILLDEEKTIDDLIAFDEITDWDSLDSSNFWNYYDQIPIVNPTKWKFHETVFEEAYYQILRHLSFELERPNSVLITFGFSFADEHILHLVQRSLSNPTLTVYVSCFNDSEKQDMKHKFRGYKNIKYIQIDEELNFQRFNRRVFTLSKDGEI